MSYEQADIAARTSFVENLKAHRSKERAEFEDAIAREEQERERKREAARMAPVIAAQAEQNKLRVAIREAEKQEVLAGRRDPGFVLPEHMRNLRMSSEDAQEFNGSQARKFRDSCEEFKQFNTPENRELILTYLQNQGVYIADADTFRQAFIRIRELGLFLNERTPEPQATAEPEPQPVSEVPLEKQLKKLNSIVTSVNWTDPASVEKANEEVEALRKQVRSERNPREKYSSEIVAFYAGKGYTQFDLDRLPADEYRAVMGLYGENRPRFSNVIQQ